MKNIKLSILLGAVFSMCACNSKVNSLKGATLLREPKTTSDAHYSDEFNSFKEKLKVFSNKFSESFIKNQFEDGKNIAVSPLSLEMCLGLAICGSNGTTRQELLNAFDMDYETFIKNYSRLYANSNLKEESNGGSDMFEIMLRNSIWIDDNVKLKESGLDALRDKCYCYSYETDFNSKKANEAIAKFIELETKGLIKPTLNFDPRTLFTLINTLYLKDIWNDTGSDLYFSNNPEHYFINSDKTKSSKKLLQAYYHGGKAISNNDYSSFFTLTENGFKIYFVKPNEGKDIKSVFNKEAMGFVLDTKNYVYTDDEKKEHYETRCLFPEFNADCDVDLIPILSQDFDIKALFDSEKCDFSNLSEDPVFCKELKQISKLDVNKKGIEGAAVTYMAMNGTAGPGEYTIVSEDFVVNKEFGFILTYQDAVLFSGVVSNIDK